MPVVRNRLLGAPLSRWQAKHRERCVKLADYPLGDRRGQRIERRFKLCVLFPCRARSPDPNAGLIVEAHVVDAGAMRRVRAARQRERRHGVHRESLAPNCMTDVASPFARQDRRPCLNAAGVRFHHLSNRGVAARRVIGRRLPTPIGRWTLHLPNRASRAAFGSGLRDDRSHSELNMPHRGARMAPPPSIKPPFRTGTPNCHR